MPVDPVHEKTCRRDPGSLLTSQIKALAGDRASVTLNRERPWASITFAGTRHSLEVNWAGVVDSEAVENLARALPLHEFVMPGYFLADILVTEQSGVRLLVEALSIIDPVKTTGTNNDQR